MQELVGEGRFYFKTKLISVIPSYPHPHSQVLRLVARVLCPAHKHPDVHIQVSCPGLPAVTQRTFQLSTPPHVSSSSSVGGTILVLDVPFCTLQGMTVINLSILFHVCESSEFTHSTLSPSLGDLKSCAHICARILMTC